MTTQERIAKIDKLATERDRKIEDERVAKAKRIFSLLTKVESFAPRMRELMKVARSLRANLIPLAPQFVSEGIEHRIGFIVSGSFWHRETLNPEGFGIIGGGAFGNDIQFNEDGKLCELVKDNGMPKSWTDSDSWNLNRFVSGFDEFERKFYEYVDNL